MDGHGIEVLAGIREYVAADIQAGHLCTSQGRQLPAQDTGVARILGIVAPTAILGVLGGNDEVHRFLGGRADLLVGREPIGFRQGDSRQAVAIHHLHATPWPSCRQAVDVGSAIRCLCGCAPCTGLSICESDRRRGRAAAPGRSPRHRWKYHFGPYMSSQYTAWCSRADSNSHRQLGAWPAKLARRWGLGPSAWLAWPYRSRGDNGQRRSARSPRRTGMPGGT